jgi:phage head maturation protease
MKRSELYELILGQRDASAGLDTDLATRDTDVITRAATLVPNSLNEQSRSVTATLTTEDPVPIYDWRSDRVVLEVLMVDGATFDPQTPLLRDHRQYSVDAILGSVTDARAENDELVGVVTFGEDLDPGSEAIWKRVKQGHLRRVSVGYGYTTADYVTIPAGRSQEVNGRTFNAPKDRDLRVVFRWSLREVSVVVIPADKRAQMRAAQNASATNPTTAQQTNQQASQQVGTPGIDSQNSQSRDSTRETAPDPLGTRNVDPIITFLRGHGLPQDINTRDAALTWARTSLSHEHVSGLRDAATTAGVTIDVSQYRQAPTPPVAPVVPATNPITPAGQRQDTQPGTGGEDPVVAERSRQTQIRTMAGQFPQVPADVVTRCLDGGLSIDQTRAEFMNAIAARSQPPVPATAPAAHIRGGITLRALQAGLMLREGIDPDCVAIRSQQAEMVTGRREFNCGWMAGAARTGQARDEVESAFDEARRLRLSSGSLMRFCEAIVELNSGNRSSWNDDETLERAFSSADFSAVFGAVIHMSVVAGYTETPATYQEFCRVVDVTDFRKNSETMVNGMGRLKKQGKPGGQAALLNPEDPTLAEYAAERYAGMLKISDQTIINDTFGITGQFPREVGISARQIPTDLVFAILLGNPTLSDSAALFVDGTNMVDAELNEAGIATAGVLLKNQKIGQKRIVISESVILHGTTLELAAKKIINATTIGGGDTNVTKDSYRRVYDSAVDMGVSDPSKDPEVTVAGLPNSYFLFGVPQRSLVVAFRRGTNRGPITRTAIMDKGEFGVCWDVVIDCGAAATSRKGVVRVNTGEE